MVAAFQDNTSSQQQAFVVLQHDFLENPTIATDTKEDWLQETSYLLEGKDETIYLRFFNFLATLLQSKKIASLPPLEDWQQTLHQTIGHTIFAFPKNLPHELLIECAEQFLRDDLAPHQSKDAKENSSTTLFTANLGFLFGLISGPPSWGVHHHDVIGEVLLTHYQDSDVYRESLKHAYPMGYFFDVKIPLVTRIKILDLWIVLAKSKDAKTSEWAADHLNDLASDKGELLPSEITVKLAPFYDERL